MADINRKNYSFYMPDDFSSKLKVIKDSNDKIKSLSMSQALYYIITEMAEKIEEKKSE